MLTPFRVLFLASTKFFRHATISFMDVQGHGLDGTFDPHQNMMMEQEQARLFALWNQTRLPSAYGRPRPPEPHPQMGTPFILLLVSTFYIVVTITFWRTFQSTSKQSFLAQDVTTNQ